MAEKIDELSTNEILDHTLLGPRLRSIIEKYGYVSDGDMVTDELIVPTYIHGDEETSRIIIKDTRMFDYVVYVHDEDGLTPRYSFVNNSNNTEIYDSNGNEITFSEELENVHRLIIAAGHAAQHAVEQRVDTFSIQIHAVEGLKTAIEHHKQEIARLERLLSGLEGKEDAVYTTYKVTIIDAWEREGGKSVSEIFLAETVKEAIQAAVDKFKRINNRADVQFSKFTVNVYDGVEQVLEVPQEVIEPFVRAITKQDRVAAAQM